MHQYFIHDGSRQEGPFSIGQLSGKINSETMIWREGLEEWKQAKLLPELTSIINPLQPPPLSNHSNSNDQLPLTPPPFLQAANTRAENGTKKSSYKKPLILVTSAIAVIAVIVFIVMLRNENQVVQQENESLSNSLQSTQQQIQTLDSTITKKQEEQQKRFREITARQKYLRNNWTNFIQSEIETYTPVSFGGFENILLKVSNKTEYPVDLVVLQVSYWKEGGGLYKTETLTVADLAPRSSDIISAPNSNRGVRLTVDVIKITARKFSFCFDISSSTNGFADSIVGAPGDISFDPWKCQ